MSKPLPDPQFKAQRGMREVPMAEAQRLLNPSADESYELCGLRPLASRHLSKTTLLLGAPGAGKTQALNGTRRSFAKLFLTRPRGQFRVLDIDPSGDAWDMHARALPMGVPLVNLTPSTVGHVAVDWAASVKGDAMRRQNLVDALFGGAMSKQTSQEPFWQHLARFEMSSCLLVLDHFAPGRWTLADALMGVRYPEFLKPLLDCLPETRGMAEQVMSGRMGKGVYATMLSELAQVLAIAAYDQRATRRMSVERLVSGGHVMHMSFHPAIASGMGRFASALSQLIQVTAFERNREHDSTVIIADELHELGDLGVDRGAARGRQNGVSYFGATQSVSNLIEAWGEQRTKKLLECLGTLVCMSVGRETAEYFAGLIGKAEGVETSHTMGTSSTFNESSASMTGTGKSVGAGPGGGNWSESENRSQTITIGNTNGTTENRTSKLSQRDALAPGELVGLPLADFHGGMHAVVFNRDLGGFTRTSAVPARYYDGLPRRPHVPRPQSRPPRDGDLVRWTAEDLERLNLPDTEGLKTALNKGGLSQ